jgi:nitrogen fixation protein FixH
MSIDVWDAPVEGRATTVRFFVVDSAGQPVRPESVTYYAYRPSDASADFSVPMTEEAPGRYVAEVSFPLSGVWDTLVAAQAETQEVVFDQRISVATP